MVRLFLVALIAAGLSCATPVMAKEGCGQGYHMGKKGHCVANKNNPPRKPCPKHEHLGPHGHCQPD